ncbi:Gem-associated protein 8 [Bulinus truncatus]|nr:Gem-associated protein 8 [Bulinus truncatus]
MSVKGLSSSVTSVTAIIEEETSVESESDTTESFTNITSSLLSSTDTDDKLTPELINISISKSANQMGNSPKRRKCNNLEEQESYLKRSIINNYNHHTQSQENKSDFLPRSESTGFIFPYGSSPLPLGMLSDENRLSSPEGEMSEPEKSSFKSSNSTSSDKLDYFSMSNDNTERSYYPDWAAPTWYQAKCFDHYWTHYNFVMKWYRQHINAAKTFQMNADKTWPFFQQSNNHISNRRVRHGSGRRKRLSKNARKRKNAKLVQPSQPHDSPAVKDSNSRKKKAFSVSSKNTEEDEDIEMEVTEEMVQFIEISLKHKLERDSLKKNSGDAEDTNIEIAKTGKNYPTTLAPTERPGIRRAAELKELYGAGAAMIHGMETALQMTFDRDLDRFKPKLWPNMPLKIMFV